MDIKTIHSLFLKSSGISIDTRKIRPKSIFVAIRGDKFNANTFAKEAIKKGASYAIIDDKSYYIDEKTVLVNNSIETLQELAKFHRNYLKLPIIAITGSNGKTTTKELIQVVLSKKFRTKSTIGNLNNHIGVPLTLLTFNSQTEIGIVEMGANHIKEIEFLCKIATPDYGYITNFGKAHLEGFGGFEGIIKGKSELYEYISNNNKLVFINLDDEIQVNKTKMLNCYSFGINKENADINIKSIEANPLVTIEYKNTVINSHLIGMYNANNVNAAFAIGKYFKIENESIKEALETYIPENNRSQLINRGTNQIILDAYNANPSSMNVAIENFVQLKNQHKILILGDMFELGKDSIKEHKTIVESTLIDSNIKCFFVGSDFYKQKKNTLNYCFFNTFEELASHLKTITIENSVILIKGSRGMALERTLEYIS